MLATSTENDVFKRIFLQKLIEIEASNEYKHQLNESDEPKLVTHFLSVSKLDEGIEQSKIIKPENIFEILWQADEAHWKRKMYVLYSVLSFFYHFD